jgi:hypothetical protein
MRGLSNIRSYTDRELIDRVQSHARGYTQWPGSVAKPEVVDIWVRSQEDEFDVFDDKAYTFRSFGMEKDPQFIMVTTGTTNTGSYGLMRFAEYNHLGAAVLQGDRIVLQSHAFGYHKHIKNAQHEAYVQVKAFPFYRDNNKNRKVEEIGPLYEGIIIGANLHRAGQMSSVIKNWSTACMVRNLFEGHPPRSFGFLDWLDRMKEFGKPPLSLCILNEW